MEKKWWKESVVYQIYPKSFKDSNHYRPEEIPASEKSTTHLPQVL